MRKAGCGYNPRMTDPTPVTRAVRVLPERALRALSEFFRLEAAGGILLIGAAVLALLCANSPLVSVYEGFRELPVQVRVGALDLAKPLLLWINDGLMAIFFLLVALEIKREALSGQLSERSQLVLPLACAAAGVVVPAAIFWFVNRGDAAALRGWAIPAATDIAFALGILSLLGSRVPVAMKLLLSTIAVIDDLAAIVIIALFYTDQLSLTALSWAGAAIVAMFLLNRRGVRSLTPYLLLGVVIWVCVLKSGVHATLAGVVTGLMIPHGSRRDDAAHGEEASSPLETLEHALHPWVAYAILPVFAFANAGLDLRGFSWADALTPLPLGILCGLLLGKPLGVIGAALLLRLFGVRLPQGLDLKATVGLGLLCGIGFTMSLFIASLAFSNDAARFDSGVFGVLAASVTAALAGFIWLWITLPKDSRDEH